MRHLSEYGILHKTKAKKLKFVWNCKKILSSKATLYKENEIEDKIDTKYPTTV